PFRSSRLIGAERQPTSDCRQSLQQSPNLYSLAVLLPALGVTARRLHDINKSGWWMLIALIPIVGLYLIYLLAKDSDAGQNQYGQNPKGIA
ncbi:DUF805 domain-containing protein, partial [Pseudomonas aeruginosa]|uniref:DUF805 domain-containing protein n=1 Tax=Pseudomonas aeruginosa TaxID=287 RepID=UPI00398340AD